MPIRNDTLEKSKLLDKVDLESPWLGEDLFTGEVEAKQDVRLAAFDGESTLRQPSEESDRLAAAQEFYMPLAADLVRFAQRVLNAAEGERLAVDGILGLLTRSALQRFRQRLNLGAGGILDTKTEIALAQRALEELAQQSLFAQPGVRDAQTDQALISFKSERGLGSSADLDAETRTALADALERRVQPSVRGPETQPAGATVDWTRIPADQRMAYVVKLLVDKYGYPVNSAAALVGNLNEESGVLPNRIEGSNAATPMRALDCHGHGVLTDFTAEQVMNRVDNVTGPYKRGIGLAQWSHPSRRSGLFKHRFQGEILGAAILYNMDAQVDYLVSELKSIFRRVDQVLRNPDTSLEAACDEIVYNFEKPWKIFKRGSDGKLKKLPRDHPAVQNVFLRRRKSSRSALQAYDAVQKEAENHVQWLDEESEDAHRYALDDTVDDEDLVIEPIDEEAIEGETEDADRYALDETADDEDLVIESMDEEAIAGENGESASFEALELDSDLTDLAEKIFAREAPGIEFETRKRWTRCFSATDIAKVTKVYEDNVSAAEKNGDDRCSCIVMLNVAFGQLLPLPSKSQPARDRSTRRVQMGKLPTYKIDAAMQRLCRLKFAVGPTSIDFLDRRNRTAGTLRPERLKTSIRDIVLKRSEPEGCWFAFSLAVLDGYHSVLLLVDRTAADARLWWLDQFSKGLDNDVTDSLDERLTSTTQGWWQLVRNEKGKGYKTTIRLWSLQKPR